LYAYDVGSFLFQSDYYIYGNWNQFLFFHHESLMRMRICN